MFTNNLFLSRTRTRTAIRYTPPTMKANAKTPSTMSRSKVMTSMASTLLKPIDRPATMFVLKSSVLMLRYFPTAEDRIPRMVLFSKINFQTLSYHKRLNRPLSYLKDRFAILYWTLSYRPGAPPGSII